MTAPQIIVLGSINMDLVIQSPHLPQAGETVLGGEFFQAAGGKGANQAVAAARTSSGSVGFIGAVGNDDFGKSAVRLFRRENIQTQHIRMRDGHATGVALIMVDARGENQISVASGANAQLTPADVEAVDEAFFAGAKVFVTCLESPVETVIAGLRRAKQHGLRTILNPAPAREEVRDPEVLRLVDVLTPNESEATFLSGWDAIEDLEDACIWCEQILQKGCRGVVVTRGARGCLMKEEVGDASLIGAWPVQAIDTTAAGDCFTGALATGLAEGRSLHESVQFASAAAAVSVTRRGAIPSLPSRRDVEDFIQQHPDGPGSGLSGFLAD